MSIPGWSRTCGHIDLGSSEEEAQHWLVLDREARTLSVLPVEQAAALLQQQWGTRPALPLRLEALEERIAAFSARVLPGGVVPTLETLPPSEVLTKVRAFAQTRSDEQGLVLLGVVGVGKTTLLLALVRSLAERWLAERKVARLVTVPDFLRELPAGYDAARQTQGEGYDQLMEKYQTCDVLVFDDLGAEKLTDCVEEQFYMLIDDRYRQWLPVLASSNCRKEALGQRLDRRVLDRLRETCTMSEVSWAESAGSKRCRADIGKDSEAKLKGIMVEWRAEK